MKFVNGKNIVLFNAFFFITSIVSPFFLLVPPGKVGERGKPQLKTMSQAPGGAAQQEGMLRSTWSSGNLWEERQN